MSLIIFFFNKFREDWIIYYLSFGMVVGNVLFPVWFFQGMERMKYITMLNVLAKLIFTACIFIFIREVSDYIYVPLINSLGLLVAGIIGLYVAVKDFKLKIIIPNLSFIIKTAKDSFQFFLSRVSLSIYTTSNTFFLGLFTTNQIVGYYSAAEKLYIAAQNLYRPLIGVLYPYISKSKDKALYKKVFKFSVLVNTLFCILFILFSSKIVILLFGSNFQESIIVLKLFLLALLVVLPSQLLGYPFLAALGYARYANGSVIIGSIFHLMALIFISLSFIRSFTVALLVVITESIVFIIRLYAVKKNKLWSTN